MERIKEVPIIGPVINIFDTYPRISAWVILSAGIIILLLLEARDVGLTVGNWIALIIVSIIVAGLSIWIVSWEDEDEAAADSTVVKSKTSEVEAVSDADDAKPSDDEPEAESSGDAAAGDSDSDSDDGDSDDE